MPFWAAGLLISGRWMGRRISGSSFTTTSSTAAARIRVSIFFCFLLMEIPPNYRFLKDRQSRRKTAGKDGPLDKRPMKALKKAGARQRDSSARLPL